MDEDREVIIKKHCLAQWDPKSYLLDQTLFMSCGIVTFLVLIWIVSHLPIVGPCINGITQSIVGWLAVRTGVIVVDQNTESYV